MRMQHIDTHCLQDGGAHTCTGGMPSQAVIKYHSPVLVVGVVQYSIIGNSTQDGTYSEGPFTVLGRYGCQIPAHLRTC